MGRPRLGQEPKVTVSFSLDPATVEWLDRLAKRKSVSRSETLQQILGPMAAHLDLGDVGPLHDFADELRLHPVGRVQAVLPEPTHIGVVDNIDPDGTIHTTEVISRPGQPPETQQQTRRVAQQETVTQDEPPVPQQETTIGQRIQNGAITHADDAVMARWFHGPRITHETLTSKQPRSHIHITAQDGCGHPKKNRVNLGYATICGTCGKRL